MKFNKKQKISFLIITIISIVVMYLGIKKDYEGIINALKNINIYWLILAFLTNIVCWLLEAVVYKKICNIMNVKSKFYDIYNIIISTKFFNAITPASSGGQPFQIYMLKKKTKADYSQITSIVTQNFILYIFSFSILVSICIVCDFIFLGNILNLSKKVILFVSVGIFANLLGAFVFSFIMEAPTVTKKIARKIIKLLNKINIVKNVDKKIEETDEFIDNLKKNKDKLSKNKKETIKMLILLIIQYLLVYFVTYFIFRAMGLKIDLILVILASMYIYMASSIIITPGASGATEISFYVILNRLIPEKSILSAMIIWRLMTFYILNILIGYIYTLLILKGERKDFNE